MRPRLRALAASPTAWTVLSLAVYTAAILTYWTLPTWRFDAAVWATVGLLLADRRRARAAAAGEQAEGLARVARAHDWGCDCAPGDPCTVARALAAETTREAAR